MSVDVSVPYKITRVFERIKYVYLIHQWRHGFAICNLLPPVILRNKIWRLELIYFRWIGNANFQDAGIWNKSTWCNFIFDINFDGENYFNPHKMKSNQCVNPIPSTIYCVLDLYLRVIYLYAKSNFVLNDVDSQWRVLNKGFLLVALNHKGTQSRIFITMVWTTSSK